MYNKNEIMNAIEINNEAIKNHSEKLKKLNKILAMISGYEEEYNTYLMNPIEIHNKIEEIENEIQWHKEALAKRKKQLKLIEQLEELN